jgi:polyvinyl alcohol dehydrogenase (cytochrome)
MNASFMRVARRLLAPVAIVALTVQVGPTRAEAPARAWPSAGQNVENTRSAPDERSINAGNVARLTTRWSFTAAGVVSATPTAAGGTAYFPDFGGRLWAVDSRTGAVRWSRLVSDLTGTAGDVSRTSPAVVGDEIVLGDNNSASPSPNGASVFAVDRRTGRLLWDTRVDAHPAAIITGSPVVFAGTVYAGVSSFEEMLATAPGYACCTFQGSVVALDARTGKLRWKTPTVPDGFSGGAVWGSTPAIGVRSGLLYVGTGNNYSVPAGVCTTPGQTGCTAPPAGDHIDSVLALDRATGAVRWARSTFSGDVFTDVCRESPSPACGSDFDFGSGPNLITLRRGRQLLGIGQKSGVYWAFDPETGRDVWHTQVGPGSGMGGIQWGSATDGRRIYVASADFHRLPYTITSASGQRSTISGGSWAALDAATGRIVWQTADPQGAADIGFVSTAGGVVYAGSTAATGDDMYALDAATGAIRWRFAGGGAVVSGAAIVDGEVLWGSGYFFATACPGAPPDALLCGPPAGANAKVYAFSVHR